MHCACVSIITEHVKDLTIKKAMSRMVIPPRSDFLQHTNVYEGCKIQLFGIFGLDLQLTFVVWLDIIYLFMKIKFKSNLFSRRLELK